VKGRGGEGEILGLLIGGSELEWECEKSSGGIDRVHYAPGSH